MKIILDRFFGYVDRFFNDSWVVIWQVDDF